MVKIGELLLHLRLVQTHQATPPIHFLRVSALVYLAIAPVSRTIIARTTERLMVDATSLRLRLFEKHVIDFVMRLVLIICTDVV